MLVVWGKGLFIIYFFQTHQAVTMQAVVRDWNKSVEVTQALVKEANAKLLDDVRSQNLDPETLLRAWVPVPKPLAAPSVHWARWFLKSWGWSIFSKASDAQGWLPFDHCDMQATRQRMQDMLESGQIHGAMCLNFDQLWRSCWAFGGKLYTNVDQKREKGTSVATPKKHDKKLHTIKGARRGITVPRMLLSCYDSCDGGQRDTVERTSKANMAPFKMQFVGSKHVQY